MDVSPPCRYRGTVNHASWVGPPGDILGYPVPLAQFIVKTEQAAVALQQVIAFPQGCSLALRIAVRRGSLKGPAWERILGRLTGEDPHSAPGGADLKFGVCLPGGLKATTVDNAFEGWMDPADWPEPPMLSQVGGGSASGDQSYHGDRELWLWPLPPREPFEFVIEWKSMGVGSATATLDGDAIARAAEQALPYWE